jgi:hypothetical protein
VNGMRVRWNVAEEDHLLFLRDREKLVFRVIAERLGRSEKACVARYYSRLFARNGARHFAVGHANAHKGRPAAAPAPAVSSPAAAPQKRPAPAVAPERRPNLAALRDWTDLCARIAECGLTGGVLGDPPPGRSALDERLHGRQAPLQPSLSRGGPHGV